MTSGTYAECGELEPEDEEGLEGEVPREVVEHNAQREAFRKVEEAEDDPVREPLDVILMARSLERLDGEIRGEAPANEVGDGSRERVDRVEDGEDEDGAEEGIALRHLGSLLKGVEDGVF